MFTVLWAWDDVRSVAYDTTSFSSRYVAVRQKESLPPYYSPPVTADPPKHRAARMALLPAFTAEAAKQLESPTRLICRNLLKAVAGRLSCEAVVEYTSQVPLRLIARMLGFAEDEATRCTAEISNEQTTFFYKQIADRRAAPKDDLLSFLINAKIGGRSPNDDQIVRTVHMLLIAGVETVAAAIGSSLLHLATHPATQSQIRSEPSILPAAVEEFLRAFAPVTMARVIDRDVMVGGCPMQAGRMVLLPFAAANRDPGRFADPDHVAINRPWRPHAAFGMGIHHCIGSHLARMQLTIALEEWLSAMPTFTIDATDTVRWSQGFVRGPLNLPMIFG